MTVETPLCNTGSLAGALEPEVAARLADECLLERFVLRRDEVAFETLVTRYGPMVLRVCRRTLGHTQDAEDVFQTTFLALARQGASIRDPRVLGPWLREVAYRGAVRARARAARTRFGVQERALETAGGGPVEEASRGELRTLIRAEVAGLPEHLHLTVVHSYLGGKTNQEVARLLRCPVGTVKARLSRARDMLRTRLSRRGLGPGPGRTRAGFGLRDIV
jgi:RNA polymerase sigma factor (sigma-70 family)